jgi:hypothetical protein
MSRNGTGAGQNHRKGHEVESYVTALVSVAFGILSIFGDLVSSDLRWTVCLTGIGILVYRSARTEDGEDTTSDAVPSPDEVEVLVVPVPPTTTAEDGLITVSVRLRLTPPPR